VEAAMKPAAGKPAMEAPMESTGAAHATMESGAAHATMESATAHATMAHATMAHATMAHATHTLGHCRRGCQGKDGG